ncbi:uncharacterized protein LOC143376017 [Andrena cerasifolii]|uniref:uncharacterized protein LOC143376017 n=1 Tax=Andrena cerasifolii TaxID=2819439 RepID=UPI00403806FA
MNTDVLQDHAPRYAKLAEPKKRIDTVNNYDAFNVKRGALSYQITDSLNKLAQPKRKPGVNAFKASSSSVKTTPGDAEKQGHRKLINSNEQSKYTQESKKKKFLLDTYARIVAARNKCCTKRLHDLAKPKNYNPHNQTPAYEDFDNYFQTIKKYKAVDGKH